MRTILTTLFLFAGCLHAARADKPPTFCGQSVDGWIKIVRDKASKPYERETAIWALGCFGPDAKAAVPDILEEMRRAPSNSGDFRYQLNYYKATDALIQIGQGAEVAISYLTDQFLKAGCLHYTGMGTFLVGESEKIRLVKIGAPAVPRLREIMKGPDTSMRVCAAAALGEIGPAAKDAVPDLIRAVEHPEADEHAAILRRIAIQALGRIGPDAKAAVPILNGVMDKDDEDQVGAMVALTGMGAPPIRKLLDQLIREGDWTVTQELTWLGPKARETTPSLRDGLNDERPQVHISAAVALAHIDPSAVEAIPVLIEALKHPRDTAEIGLWDIAGAFAKFGPKASAAIPIICDDMMAQLLDNDGYVDIDMLKALVQIDPEGKECVPILVSALETGDASTVDTAASSLGLLGPLAKDAVPSLAKAVTRHFESINSVDRPHVSAANALRRIGPGAKSAIPTLISALKYRGDEDDCFAAASTAAEVLGSFRAEAKTIVPALIEAAQTCDKEFDNSYVRKAAILALGRFGPDAKAALPILRNLLGENRECVSVMPESLITLYRLDPKSKGLAEEWLQNPLQGRVEWERMNRLEDRVMVLGALGRTSFEGDWLTRHELDHLDAMLAYDDPRDEADIEDYEWWFEKIARYGPAARLAVPRLKEYRKHPSPWVRMWASEALSRIVRKSPG